MPDISPSRLLDQKVLAQKFSSDALLAVVQPITKHLYETADRLLKEFKDNLDPNLSEEDRQAKITEFETKLIPSVHQHIRNHAQALAGGMTMDNFPEVFEEATKAQQVSKIDAGSGSGIAPTDNDQLPPGSQRFQEPAGDIVIGIQGIESEERVMTPQS